MTDTKKYIVTAKSGYDSGSLLHDISLPGSDSPFVPSREVDVADLRLVNSLNTSYYLTDEEAEALRQDPRVESVENIEDLPIDLMAFQSGDFPKNSATGFNWGLIRHTNSTNIYGSGFSSEGATYDYVLDGTGVDIVFLDTGIQVDHPEFLDANGNSRVKQINWFTASGVPGTMPANHYTDFSGHGTHVASVAAGRTFGWARNADIYSIKILAASKDPNPRFSVDTALDCVLGWHLNKTNGRPTILNNSWSYIIYNRSSEGVFSFSQTGGTIYPINGGVYRGSSWSGSTLDINKGHSSASRYGYIVNSVDADISQLIDAGIFVCNAAGNSSLKNDVVGGTDYDNYIVLNGIGNYNYHQSGSPNVKNKKGFQVGSIGIETTSNLDNKSPYSNSGPNVGVYAAGGSIIGALSQISDYLSVPYHSDGNFRQIRLSGTSMASPQIAGIAALILQVHPTWTPAQVHSYIVNNSTQGVYNTGLDNDYAVSSTIHGGNNRLAYLPMSGRKVYSIFS